MLLLALISAAAAQDCVRVRVGEVLPLQTLAAASCVELQDRAASTVDWIWGDSICRYTGRFALTGAGCYPDPRQLGASSALRWNVGGVTIETPVTGTPRAPETQAAIASNGTLRLPAGAPSAPELILFRPGQRPMRLTLSGGKAPLPSVDLSGAWVLVEDVAYGVQVGAPARSEDPAPTPKKDKALSCALTREEQLSLGQVQLICVDRTQPGTPPVFQPAIQGFMRPNVPIVVKMRCPDEDTCEASLSGDAGLTASTVTRLSTTAASAETVNDKAFSEESEVEPSPYTRIFAPRQPGVVTLTVTDSTGSDELAEWVVAQPVNGAVRIGVSLGSVPDYSYEVITAPGSQTQEIVVDGGKVQPEIVIGWAPFLNRGGRVYEDPTRTWRPSRDNLAPYLGLGVLSLDAASEPSISLLRSVYLGFEWELMRSSSLAFTGTVRRVELLAEPFEVGGPSATNVPTLTTWTPGVALIFNFSPEFMEIARNPLNLGGS